MSEAALPAESAPKRKPRIFLWVFLAIQVLCLAWVFWAGSDSDPTTSILAVFMVLGTWAFIDFMLAVIYGVYRLAKRA